ncbi:MAG: GNAT family N-acetyltransferase [Flavisolibacter sp.]|nr:GNAT family N-acetyltransferase [Flavisolibacter sp.]MBD0367303.1 GNAT family N-acetyltransferase [Flavisolibacter sp.]
MIIRKATLKDSEFIATHLLLAMEDIVYQFIGGKDPEKAKELLLYFAERENNQYSYQNCWVAVNDKEVVATVNVYNGAQLRELRQPVIEHIRSRFNKDFQPEDETQEGEYYIDSLGVNPDLQGKGIGSKILQFLIDEYAIKRSQTLGLLVEEENLNAKRLYFKLGFKSAGKKVLFGKNMEHLQFKGE